MSANEDYGDGMGLDGSSSRPGWVSDELFPFESRFFTTASGHQMHYVDEGRGDPVVFVHGNPAWSFEFRHLIAGLRPRNRCIAADHIGFGLSSRSSRSGDHHPRAHADAFAALLSHLEVRDLTLFLTDWGGPIGLDFARKASGTGEADRHCEHLVLASRPRPALLVV